MDNLNVTLEALEKDMILEKQQQSINKTKINQLKNELSIFEITLQIKVKNIKEEEIQRISQIKETLLNKYNLIKESSASDQISLNKERIELEQSNAKLKIENNSAKGQKKQ